VVLPATTSAKEGLAGGAACVDPEAPGEAAAVAAGRCWLALRFLPADFGAPLAAGTCGAETVALAEGEGGALAASNCFRTRATRPSADLGALLARSGLPALSASLIAPSRNLATYHLALYSFRTATAVDMWHVLETIGLVTAAC